MSCALVIVPPSLFSVQLADSGGKRFLVFYSKVCVCGNFFYKNLP